MDILGIGPMELVLILIVALAVFGPDKLPGMGAKLGRAMRDMRKATRAFSEEISTPAKEIMEPLQEIRGAVKTMGEAAAVVRNPSEAIRQSVTRELNYKPEPAAENGQPAAEGDAVAENRIAPPAADEAVPADVTQAQPASVPEAPAIPATAAEDPGDSAAPEAADSMSSERAAAAPTAPDPEAAAPEAAAGGPGDPGEGPQLPPPDPDPLEKA